MYNKATAVFMFFLWPRCDYTTRLSLCRGPISPTQLTMFKKQIHEALAAFYFCSFVKYDALGWDLLKGLKDPRILDPGPRVPPKDSSSLGKVLVVDMQL